MSEDGTLSWEIPTNISYEPYKKIVGAFYQKNADTTPIVTKIIATAVGLTPKTVASTIRFLLAIKVLEGDSSNGYKLTKVGAEYAKAIFKEDSQIVKQTFSEIIKNCYLNSLKDHIELQKGNLSIDGLYKFIKTEGRFAEGRGTAGMLGPYATGARTLLQIFDASGMYPENFDISTIKETQMIAKSGSKKIKPSTIKDSKNTAQKYDQHDGWVKASFDDFNMSMRKDIDKDTFEFIKTQISSTLEFWGKKYLNNNDNIEDPTL